MPAITLVAPRRQAKASRASLGIWRQEAACTLELVLRRTYRAVGHLHAGSYAASLTDYRKSLCGPKNLRACQ